MRAVDRPPPGRSARPALRKPDIRRGRQAAHAEDGECAGAGAGNGHPGTALDDAGTRAQAEIKLKAITNKIGYPDKWRDYSSVKIVRGDALGNSQRATQFEFHRRLDKISKPVDRTEWGMTPPTVNAYYDPQMNNINFPAGILQPPFFDKNMDEAVNFGAIGAVVGHELTHGFDDEGRQFDA